MEPVGEITLAPESLPGLKLTLVDRPLQIVGDLSPQGHRGAAIEGEPAVDRIVRIVRITVPDD